MTFALIGFLFLPGIVDPRPIVYSAVVLRFRANAGRFVTALDSSKLDYDIKVSMTVIIIELIRFLEPDEFMNTPE